VIKISGDYTLNARPTEVWRRILAPSYLRMLIPGCQRLDEVMPGVYEGHITLALPAVSGEFDTRVSMEEQVPPYECSLTGEVSGSAGRIAGRVGLRLIDVTEGTLLNYEAEGIVTGALAKLPTRAIEAVARTLLQQGLSKLNRELKSESKLQAE